MTSVRAGAATDVGLVRQNNEDNLLVASPLFAVADGMGGHAAGEVASQIAIDTLAAHFRANPTANGLADAVRAANEAVFAHARTNPSARGMGTTLTAVALVREDSEGDDSGDGEEVLAIVNVGDSRAYRLQQGLLERITEDHSVVEELVRTGRLTEAEAAVHPQRHVLTRVLGVDPDVEVDCFRVIPFRGDRFLLASDGLFNEVDDDDIASVLRTTADPDAACRELVRLAKDSGGADNITVVVVDVTDDDDRARAAATALGASRSGPRSDRSSPAVAPPPAAEPAPWEPRTARQAPGGGAASSSGRGGAAPPPRREARGRRLTWRVAAFTLVLLSLLGGAVGVIGWFARGTYFVGFDGDRVAIFQGRPGGLLWFDPTIVERSTLQRGDVPPARIPDVEKGKEEPSLADARRYIANLEDQAGSGTGPGATAPGTASTVTSSPFTPSPAGSTPSTTAP